MNIIICWLKEIWRSIPQWIDGSYGISGHLYVDKEYHTGCNVTISECEECGKISITWSGGKEVDDMDKFVGEHFIN